MPVYIRGKKFTPAPEGLHQAVCVDVVELGEITTEWGKKEMVKLVWQIEEENPETNKRFLVSKRYNSTLNEKGNLCKDLVAWRGRKFTSAERELFDLEQVLGANCQLQVSHNIKEGGDTYANVTAIVKLGRGMLPLNAIEYVREQDRDTQRQPVDNGHEPGPDDDIPFDDEP